MKRGKENAVKDTSITISSDPDKDEIRRITMVVRGGEATATGREAWLLTLQSGREVVLIIPQKVADELAQQHGYVGRIRPITDDDEIEVAESAVATMHRRREATKGGAIQ